MIKKFSRRLFLKIPSIEKMEDSNNIVSKKNELNNEVLVLNRRNFIGSTLSTFLGSLFFTSKARATGFFMTGFWQKSATTSTQYVDDVFSSYPYTGTGGAQTITNGLDLSSNGGMVWMKNRGSAVSHLIADTSRGGTNVLQSNSTASNTADTGYHISGFTSSGFSLQNSGSGSNAAAASYMSWTFRKAANFFDIVTYTGTGVNRTIAHNLGSVPGMIIIKRLDANVSWAIYHTSIGNTKVLQFDTSAATTDSTSFNNTSPTSSVFTVGTAGAVNANGGSYVAYIYAHDTSTNGTIQCGTFTLDGAGAATVTLGWEPQFLMFKESSGAQDWFMTDTIRGMCLKSYTYLNANLTNAEAVANGLYLTPTATGFNATGFSAVNQTYVYMVIRRSNKPPTVGTQVYNAITRTGTGGVANITGAGFVSDAVFSFSRNSANGLVIFDKIRGINSILRASSNAVEYNGATNSLTSFNLDGFSAGADSTMFSCNDTGMPYVHYFFKRAPSVFDVVCYTSTSMTTNNRIAHNLGAVPELAIFKQRDSVNDWYVYHSFTGTNMYMLLDQQSAAAANANSFGTSAPTTTDIGMGEASLFTGVGTRAVYLFATKAGISKVGNYTGNGTSLTINCGFTTGARFILIKCTSAGGAWFLWDTARGINAGNDPHLSVNTTAAEVTTDDSIDSDNSGFIVNQLAATNINVTSATYIYLAMA